MPYCGRLGGELELRMSEATEHKTRKVKRYDGQFENEWYRVPTGRLRIFAERGYGKVWSIEDSAEEPVAQRQAVLAADPGSLNAHPGLAPFRVLAAFLLEVGPQRLEPPALEIGSHLTLVVNVTEGRVALDAKLELPVLDPGCDKRTPRLNPLFTRLAVERGGQVECSHTEPVGDLVLQRD